MLIAQLLASLVSGYLLGSVSFAIVTSKLFGLADPRSYGSHNPGATNVLRSGNKVAALLTLLGDALKGAVAVWAAQALAPQFLVPTEWGAAFAAAAGLGAFAGHLYPIYHRFAGGKGVATFFGVLLALNPWLALVAGIAWLAMAMLSRYSSLASLTAALVAPVVQGVFWSGRATAVAIALMSVLLALRHRENIAKLRAGTESKLSSKK
jgi:glycerol-3-phosphate acyltransferase PlsY